METETKASAGATELAEKLLKDDRVHYFSHGQFKYCPSAAAALIDAALVELREAARATIAESFTNAEHLAWHEVPAADLEKLALALLPWEARHNEE